MRVRDFSRGGLSIIFILGSIKGGGSNDSSSMPPILPLIHILKIFYEKERTGHYCNSKSVTYKKSEDFMNQNQMNQNKNQNQGRNETKNQQREQNQGQTQNPQTKSRMDHRRIAAIIGIVLLVLLYVVTLITAIIDTPFSGTMFGICLLATFVVPLIIWVYTWMYGKLTGKATIADFNIGGKDHISDEKLQEILSEQTPDGENAEDGGLK